MTNKFQETAPAWPAKSMLERFYDCRAMLYLHGFLTDSENDRVHAKIIKAAGKAGTPADQQQTSTALTAADVVVGRPYIWEPMNPRARCRVVVDEIRREPNGDVRVFTTITEGNGSDKAGIKVWNDMSRFIEACTPAAPPTRGE